MSRAKKIVRWSLVALLVLLVAGYLVGNVILNRVSRRAVAALAQRGKLQRVEISEPNFQSARISGLRSAQWTDLSAELRFPESEVFDSQRVFSVAVERIRIRWSPTEDATVEAEGVVIDSEAVQREGDSDQGNSGEVTRERLVAEQLQTQIELKLLDPMSSLEAALPELVRLIAAGKTSLPVDSQGYVSFFLKGAPAEVRFSMVESDGKHSVVLEADSLRSLSEEFDDPLTEAEIALVAAQPLRAPRLLRIKEDAESSARRAYLRDRQVPEDAYRHILWSYLLTNAYGAGFARQVTDAHEEGPTGNTEAERKMDYHNNRIGRQYAKEELGRGKILSRVQSDTKVIRQAK